MEFKLNLSNVPFDLGHTLDSGQSFRWALRGEWWYGVVLGSAIKVRQEEASLVCETASERLTPHLVHEYFRLDDSLERIYSKIMKDDHITEAIQRFYGLRLINQDVWECLVSFVIATNTNIPRIKLMISNLCERFGEKASFEGNPYPLFPAPPALPIAAKVLLAIPPALATTAPRDWDHRTSTIWFSSGPRKPAPAPARL